MKNIIFLITMICSSLLQAQNLVPNPSFEEYISCPISSDEFYNASGWSNYGYSPDYYNTCATTSTVSIPSNYCGYQFAASGNAYCGILTYANYLVSPGIQPYREIIGTKLLANLEKGIKYYVSLKASLGFIETSYNQINCATNNLGIKFTNTPFNKSKPRIDNICQINETSIITDTTNWTRIFGSFVSDSTYQYIAIGNFHDNIKTDTLIMDESNSCYFAYFYIDDICISTDSLYSANYIWTGINESNKFPKLYIYPNPASNSLNIDFSSLKNNYDVEIIDALGRNIIKQTIYDQHTTFDISNVANGLFLIKIKIKFNNQFLFYKFLKF